MVYVPPSASAAEAQRRVEQLRQARIGDLFVINEGPLRLAISLGVFRSVEGARTHQLALVARGVSDAQVGPGPGAGADPPAVASMSTPWAHHWHR
jgi:hypothetical protein